MVASPDLTADDIVGSSLDILGRLVSFDTTSQNSNLDLIHYVRELTAAHCTDAVVITDGGGGKANLLIRFGPMADDGIVLSGHSDVVPVTGQQWSSEPFTLTLRDGKAYGRGTADMKAFLAVALACAPMMAAAGRLTRPIHLAISYDEEVGCLGAPALIQAVLDQGFRPAAVVVGEPSGMKVIAAHKGTVGYTISVKGVEAHSSQTQLGKSANMLAIPLLASLARIATQLESAETDEAFDPPNTTLNVGMISGGTALNILAGRCEIVFDLRYLPENDPDIILAPLFEDIARINAQMAERGIDAGVTVERIVAIPGFARRAGSDAERLVATLAGDNGVPLSVSFASEAGQFQQAGFASIICGPGSIEQAHQPDEYVEIAQLHRCAEFMLRLIEHLSRQGQF